MRANVDVANLRTTFSSERAALYGDLMAILLRLGRTREAFQVADASRGRALLEHLGAARSTLRAGTPVHDLVEGEDLLRRIDVVTRALAEAQDEDSRFRTAPVSDRAADLKNQLADLRSRYEAHLVRASTRDSSSAALLGLRPASVSEVQQALHPDEALVQFVVLPEYLVAFVITSDGLAMHKTRVAAEELRSRVRLARQLLADPEAGAGD